MPAIITSVLEHGPDYAPEIALGLARLAADLRENAPLPAPAPALPQASTWRRALASRGVPRWLETDWFFAETYAYRVLCEIVGYWQNQRDPFLPIKAADYASGAPSRALDAAAGLDGPPRAQLGALLAAAAFGNRMDLSFAASRERGTQAASDDLLLDDRGAAVDILLGGTGAVHFLIDNAGAELCVDLVLASRFMRLCDAPVVLHLKSHPCFVSDATEADARWLVSGDDAPARSLWRDVGDPARTCRAELAAALANGRLRLAPHPFWNSPGWLWEAPAELERELGGARLVILKGDAHYRRAVGDALWAADTPTAAVTRYFPAPLLLLRTLKSDPIVGLSADQREALDRDDPSWRVNGRRALAALGGTPPAVRES